MSSARTTVEVVVEVAVGVTAGVTAWTFAEYWLHRGPMHRPGGRDPLASEHRAHHVDPAATSPSARTAGVIGVAVLGRVVTAPLRRRRRALGEGVALGWGLGYAAYDRLHWNVHHRPPSDAADTRRLRHLDHHVNPRRNFGVTTAVWDRCFGTHVVPEVVRLPRRLTPTWAADDPDALDRLVTVGGR
ncbi:MAG: sterol desaturase family protein [Actinomycetota bacterium]